MSNKNKDKGGGKRNKKRVLVVISVILLIILAVAAVIGIKYQSHIKAAIIWMTTSDEDIQKNIDDAKDKQAEVLNNSGFNASRELDEALMSGKITAQEHTEILLGNLTLEEALRKIDNGEEIPPDNPELPDETKKEDDADPPAENEPEEKLPTSNTKPGKPSGDGKGTQDKSQIPTVTPDGNKDNVEKEDPGQNGGENVNIPANTSTDVDKRTAELVTRMYVLKSEYTAQIEAIVSAMKAEYSKLPPEQRNLSAKRSIATNYLGTINAMEAQCDAQVNAIVTELRQLLSANGRDTALADTILSTYAAEKENTKAYYLSTYGD